MINGFHKIGQTLKYSFVYVVLYYAIVVYCRIFMGKSSICKQVTHLIGWAMFSAKFFSGCIYLIDDSGIASGFIMVYSILWCTKY